MAVQAITSRTSFSRPDSASASSSATLATVGMEYPAPAGDDWDVIILQPDSALPADGLYDALALGGISLAERCVRSDLRLVGFRHTGIPSPSWSTTRAFRRSRPGSRRFRSPRPAC